MIISGTIQAVLPPDYQNTFGVQYQNITIDTENGPVVGRIGKKQPYTHQNIGHQDQWDMEQAQGPQGPYNKLKKHYDRPYQGQQGGAPQPPQGGSQGTQAKEPVDWDAKDLRMARMNALTNSTKLICLLAEADTAQKPDVNLIKATAESLVDYIYFGLTKLNAQQFGNAVKQAAAEAARGPATPNPAMGEDDVPWES